MDAKDVGPGKDGRGVGDGGGEVRVSYLRIADGAPGSWPVRRRRG